MSALLCATKETTPNELNEVVISDSKFALAKVGKGNCKITSEESKKSGQSLAAFKYGCRC
jgi:hypothetical protein